MFTNIWIFLSRILPSIANRSILAEVAFRVCNSWVRLGWAFVLSRQRRVHTIDLVDRSSIVIHIWSLRKITNHHVWSILKLHGLVSYSSWDSLSRIVSLVLLLWPSHWVIQGINFCVQLLRSAIVQIRLRFNLRHVERWILISLIELFSHLFKIDHIRGQSFGLYNLVYLKVGRRRNWVGTRSLPLVWGFRMIPLTFVMLKFIKWLTHIKF